jgi:hypothetical protein
VKVLDLPAFCADKVVVVIVVIPFVAAMFTMKIDLSNQVIPLEHDEVSVDGGSIHSDISELFSNFINALRL